MRSFFLVVIEADVTHFPPTATDNKFKREEEEKTSFWDCFKGVECKYLKVELWKCVFCINPPVIQSAQFYCTIMKKIPQQSSEKILQFSNEMYCKVASDFSLFRVFLSRSERAYLIIIFLDPENWQKKLSFKEEFWWCNSLLMACFGRFFRRDAGSYNLSAVPSNNDGFRSQSVSWLNFSKAP